MKTKLKCMLAVFSLLAATVTGQDFKLSKTSGKLSIMDVNHVLIEGYNGNEIVFSSLDGPREKDKRAEGLRSINPLGLEDNTGFGLSVVDKGATIEVNQLRKMDGVRVKILVPKGINIFVRQHSPHGDEITIKNVESEIEVSTMHVAVKLENVTGPLSVSAVHAEIEAVLSPNVKGPLSISSMHGLIDITVPMAIKSNVTMSTTYGEIFVDPAIKIEMDEKNEMVQYSASKVKGKVNGGGVELNLTSPHGSIYLRKK